MHAVPCAHFPFIYSLISASDVLQMENRKRLLLVLCVTLHTPLYRVTVVPGVVTAASDLMELSGEAKVCCQSVSN